MTVLEWIRFLFGAALMLCGSFLLVTAVIGNYRFRNAPCRMHAAGLGDTLGILLLFLGLLVLCGFSVFTLKLGVIVFLLWITSPVTSHLILRMQVENGCRADGQKEDRSR